MSQDRHGSGSGDLGRISADSAFLRRLFTGSVVKKYLRRNHRQQIQQRIAWPMCLEALILWSWRFQLRDLLSALGAREVIFSWYTVNHIRHQKYQQKMTSRAP